MQIIENFKEDIENIENSIKKLKSNQNISKNQIEVFFRNLEKYRYNILTNIKCYNTIIAETDDEIKSVLDGYYVESNTKTLKIYIPEALPSFKRQKTQAHRNILLNLINITKPYSEKFKGQRIFILIKVYDKIKAWDIDNKDIKPIADALVQNKIVEDDTFDKMFYLVKGVYSENPHCEIFITNQENTLLLINNAIEKVSFFQL